jgi:hypothetical protein
MMHAKFDKIQLSIFRDTKNNVSCAPCGRRIRTWLKSSQVRTLNYYSPNAYQYVRSILCQIRPRFIKESFESIQEKAMQYTEKKDYCLIIDAMSTREQTLWDANQDKYLWALWIMAQYKLRNPILLHPKQLYSYSWVHVVIGSVQLDTFLLTKCHPKPKHSWLEFPLKWLQRLVFEYGQ